jgi:DNA (cytosine-5)-methyltransferase 1
MKLEENNMKVLNLYACLGGNRYRWDEIPGLEITAVEWDEELARLYQERFPNDTVIVADAHQYLLDHYKEFDFIWSSPPCPSHSRARYWNSSNYDTTTEAIYPDMTLYQEIIFLQHYFRTGKYVVENVIPYYEPLIAAQKRDRHLYWANFNIPMVVSNRDIQGVVSAAKDEIKLLSKIHDFDFKQYKGKQALNKIARNLVDYEAGLSILKAALNIIEKSKTKQIELF